MKPAEEEGVEVRDEAVALIAGETKGYPYFLQEWGKHAWDTALQSRILVAFRSEMP